MTKHQFTVFAFLDAHRMNKRLAWKCQREHKLKAARQFYEAAKYDLQVARIRYDRSKR